MKMRKLKRCWAMLLALCMTITMMPISAFAASGGTNTEQPFPTSIIGSGHYRIPAIVTLDNGDLVAAADARWHAWDFTDDDGDIDTIVSYSTDNGANWTYNFANYIDNGDTTNYNAATFIDPALATDGETVYMLVDLYPGIGSEANCTGQSKAGTGYDENGNLMLRYGANTSSYDYYVGEDGNIYDYSTNTAQGYTVDAYFNVSDSAGNSLGNLFTYDTCGYYPLMTSYLYLTKSTDGGATWSEPMMLNTQVKESTDTYYLVSPGRGLVTSDGTIIFGCYDKNANASFIYSNDNGATWTRTDAVDGTSSESEIVELADGTLRMFIRHYDSNYTIKYVDATKNSDGTYTWGSIVNTGIAAHNNTNVTAISYSKTSDGKQVILFACPGATSGAWSRYNGKIFTFTVDPSTNEMTLANTYEVNGSSSSYSYSCLTELNDGSIGLLYEKGDSGNITYVNYDAATITGLTFDEKVESSDVVTKTDEETGISVKASDLTDLEVKEITPTVTISNAVNVKAWDVTPKTADGNYTGEATVTVPVPADWNTKHMGAYVVNSDNSVTKISGTYENGYYTYTCPHFSETGVYYADYDSVDVNLYVGQSTTITDKTGNYEESYTGKGLNTAVAAVDVKGITSEGGITTETITSLAAGDTFYILVSEGTYLNSDAKETTDVSEAAEWTVSLAYPSYFCAKNRAGEYLAYSIYDGICTTSTAAYLKLTDGVVSGYYSGTIGTAVSLEQTEAADATTITITGVAAGNTSVDVGETRYNITVEEAPEVVEVTKENTPIIGNTGAEGVGDPITGLVISTDTSYDLNLADDVTDDVTWSVEDSNIATVDENGTVTGKTAGKTTVYAEINGVRYAIPVTVLATEKGTTNRTIDFYNTEVTNCTAYYSYQGADLVEFPEGTEMYIVHDYSETDIVTFFATPNTGCALTYVNGTGGTWFHKVRNSDGTSYGYDAYDGYDGCNDDIAFNQGNSWEYVHDQLVSYVVNNSLALTADQVHTMLGYAVAKKCDGAFFFSRASNQGNINSTTTFIADKLPEVDKTVNGILEATKKAVDFRTYEDGMVAAVGEYVYFTVTVTLEKPLIWQDDEETQASIEYDIGNLVDDELKGAYFYTKDLDESEDGIGSTLDGYLKNEASKKTKQDIKDELNAAWTDEEKEAGKRVLTYYVVYEIQKEDEDKDIVNTVSLSETYETHYSKGTFETESEAQAKIHVVGKYIEPIVVDFGQSVSLEDTNKDYLFRNMKSYSSKYGTVTVSKDENDIYTLTYKPYKVLQNMDVVTLYKDEDKTQILNSFTVYPATTVHYEESFVGWGDGWTTSTTNTLTQDLDFLGDTESDGTAIKNYNYGYDSMNDDYNAASNGTQATTDTIGASGTFTFTGTGVEVYANSTSDTGYVSVQIKNSEGKNVKLFMVNTKAQDGKTDATGGQSGSLYSVPIVSMQDLTYGTYTVTIKKIVDTLDVNIDGIRVFGTMEDDSIYETDGESGASYVELRDMVLDAVSVTENDSKYYDETAESILDQVYASAGTALGAVVLNDKKYNSYDTDAVQDMLDNGPKNELYLHPGETVVFDLDGVAQIGMKTVNGADVSYTYSTRGGKAIDYTMQSSTDMFYHNDAAGRVTITNTSESGLLSITLLKCWMAVGYSQDGFAGIMAALFGADDDAASPLRELTKDDIVYALEMMNQSLYGTEDEEKTPVYDMFTDVIKDEWYCTAIQYVFDNELMVGISSDMFGTYSSMTRAMLMQVLYAAEGKPEASDKNFTDVAADAWYADAVSWGAQNGLTAGYGDGRFGAEDKVTREQLATILRAYAKMKQMENKDGGITLDQFTDNSSISNWAQDSMLWAVNQGIISGRPGGILDPQGNATRAELAQMIYALVKE